MDEAPKVTWIILITEIFIRLLYIPWVNEYDIGEEVELSKIFDMTQEHHMDTTIISQLPDVVPEEKQPMTTTNTSSNSSSDKNSSRITYPIMLDDDDDDYSLSYIYSMGLKNVSMLQEDGGTSTNVINQENPEIYIPMPIVMEKQGETTNDMILQQPLRKIPILEEFKIEESLKKLVVGQENGILSSLDNEFPQSTSSGGPTRRSPNRATTRYKPFGKETIYPNNNQGSESMFNIPQNFNEYMQGYGYPNEAVTWRSLNSGKENENEAPDQLQSNSWNTQDTTNWPWGPFH
ncbi:hypothetical protein EJD97_003786 [Solanum chilense]|uniref:Uncharacterized protein n=1 Tax=Solanum chilense TaxID=4083 RepID=A0A6N2AMA6_SOLCI|nr:hypothetical protein EJD97_003786 [Solanum chilense]